MTVKYLLEELSKFDPEDHIMLGEEATSFVPEITKICGKSERYMPYYCVLKPGHSGKCYCRNKNVEFN